MMITTRSLYFFTFVVAFVVAVVAVGVFFYLRYRRRQRHPYGDWETLLNRLGRLDRDNIAYIANDALTRCEDRGAKEEPLDPDRIWHLLGGMDGVATMERNCEVLIDLVFYVQQWYPEALLVAEELRRNAREIEWHIERLKAAANKGRLKTAIPEYLEQAVAIYYRMTKEVIALYEQFAIPELADLQTVI